MKTSAINPMTGEEIRMNHYNTYISYGLNEDEKAYLRKIEKNTEKSRNKRNLEHLYYIECEDFTDVLAIPSSLILIRFSVLSQEEIETFKECFEYSDAAIFSMDKCPDGAKFVCFENCNMLDEEDSDWVYMMRVLLAMEKRNIMFSDDSIELSSNQVYSALEVYIKDDEIWVDCVKVRNGKVQLKEKLSTTDFDKVKEWVKDDIIAVWHRYKNYVEDDEPKTLDKIIFSDKLIDTHILSGTEFPYLAPINNLKKRVSSLSKETENKSNCELIALLLATMIYYKENDE